jgi:hypothetical protein
MQKGRGSRRRWKQHWAKEATYQAEMSPGRSAQAGRPSLFRGPVGLPFDLVASWAIYSPGVESHASSNSLSAAEEQRREVYHLGEERVELVY